MKKYSIYNIFNHTPKDTELSNYTINVHNIKDRVFSKINIQNDDIQTDNVQMVTIPVKKISHRKHSWIAIACSLLIISTGGLMAYDNIKSYYTVGTSKTSNDTFLGCLEMPSSATLNYTIYFNDENAIQSAYNDNLTIDKDYLNKLNEISNYSSWTNETEKSSIFGDYSNSISIDYTNSHNENISIKILNQLVCISINDDTTYYYDESNNLRNNLLEHIETYNKSNITLDTNNKLFGLFSIPYIATVNQINKSAQFDESLNTIQSYKINHDILLEMNNSMDYSKWKPINSIDNVYNQNINSITFYGQDGKYTISSYESTKFLSINIISYNGEKHNYYYDTNQDDVYSILQDIINKNDDTYLFLDRYNISTALLHLFHSGVVEENEKFSSYELSKEDLTCIDNILNLSNFELLKEKPTELENIMSNATNILSIIFNYGTERYEVFVYEDIPYIAIQRMNSSTFENITVEYYQTNNSNIYSILQDTIPQLNNQDNTSSTTLNKLELHENEIPIFNNKEELSQFEQEHTNNNSTLKIDDSKYIDMSFYEDNLTTLESKSHIYHKMLNSVEYFDSVEGNVEIIDGYGNIINVEYQSNLKNISSYTHYMYQSSDVNYRQDREQYINNKSNSVYINNVDKKYCQQYYEYQPEYETLIPDNYKSVLCKCKGETPEIQQFNYGRIDITNVDYAGGDSLLPQNIALSYMQDFNQWDITSTTTYLDRDCVIIEGTTPRKEGSFIFYVDIKTGILLKYEFGDGYTLITHDIKIDQPITIKEYSPNDYSNYEEVFDYSELT